MSIPVKTSHYIIGAVALTTALSWNGVIRESITKHFPVPKESIIAGFAYAVVITIFLIMLIEFLPDTSSELPKGTREKIEMEKEKEHLLNRITRLELFIASRYLNK
jgi:hypothetical protein